MDKMSGTDFIVKNVFLFLNLVLMMAGAVLIGLGAAEVKQVNPISELLLLPFIIRRLPLYTAILGAVVIVVAFWGSGAAIRESAFLLLIYAASMGVLAALQIWLTVSIFQNLDNVPSTVDRYVRFKFVLLSDREGFHSLEKQFSCCGVTGVNSYTVSGEKIPGTCCGNLASETCTGDTYGGCTQALTSYLETYGEAKAAMLIIVLIVELVAVMFSLYLNRTITKKQRATMYSR